MMSVTETIIRDVCETDPADPGSKDTICINVDDLRVIIDNNLAPTQGADARPVAIYQVEQAPGRWTNVSRETFDAWAFEKQIVYATRDASLSLPHDAWKAPFDERHEFDVYPDHFMTGLRNEFAAGWHAAIKAIAAIAPRGKA